MIFSLVQFIVPKGNFLSKVSSHKESVTWKNCNNSFIAWEETICFCVVNVKRRRKKRRKHLNLELHSVCSNCFCYRALHFSFNVIFCILVLVFGRWSFVVIWSWHTRYVACLVTLFLSNMRWHFLTRVIFHLRAFPFVLMSNKNWLKIL